jgi:hypothetical protein
MGGKKKGSVESGMLNWKEKVDITRESFESLITLQPSFCMPGNISKSKRIWKGDLLK